MDGWRAEVLTPSSLQQARDYANLRRAYSPDGRFALRYVRGLEVQTNNDWLFSFVVKATAWVATAVIAAKILG